ITNVLKHSQAARFEVSLEQKPEQILLRITDDGRGFNPQEFHSGLGLGLMRERAETIGATLQIASTPDQGTTLTVILPRLLTPSTNRTTPVTPELN
ncbi:MAG TPA: ATP-binding protein, partial [Phototrophicaceae bacterium]|nr:ATP-binding protein [Phototrophicaceae bacterium]